MAEEARWYVVHTYSSYENKVASTLMKTASILHKSYFVGNGTF